MTSNNNSKGLGTITTCGIVIVLLVAMGVGIADLSGHLSISSGPNRPDVTSETHD